MLRLQRVCVFFFQVLGFEVDSINSVQFSNHTGKMVQTFHICTFWVACASQVPLRWFSYRRGDRLILFCLLFIVYWIFKLLLWDILKCLCEVFVCLRGCVCVCESDILVSRWGDSLDTIMAEWVSLMSSLTLNHSSWTGTSFIYICIHTSFLCGGVCSSPFCIDLHCLLLAECDEDFENKHDRPALLL